MDPSFQKQFQNLFFSPRTNFFAHLATAEFSALRCSLDRVAISLAKNRMSVPVWPSVRFRNMFTSSSIFDASTPASGRVGFKFASKMACKSPLQKKKLKSKKKALLPTSRLKLHSCIKLDNAVFVVNLAQSLDFGGGCSANRVNQVFLVPKKHVKTQNTRK